MPACELDDLRDVLRALAVRDGERARAIEARVDEQLRLRIAGSAPRDQVAVQRPPERRDGRARRPAARRAGERAHGNDAGLEQERAAVACGEVVGGSGHWRRSPPGGRASLLPCRPSFRRSVTERITRPADASSLAWSRGRDVRACGCTGICLPRSRGRLPRCGGRGHRERWGRARGDRGGMGRGDRVLRVRDGSRVPSRPPRARRAARPRSSPCATWSPSSAWRRRRIRSCSARCSCTVRGRARRTASRGDRRQARLRRRVLRACDPGVRVPRASADVNLVPRVSGPLSTSALDALRLPSPFLALDLDAVARAYASLRRALPGSACTTP